MKGLKMKNVNTVVSSALATVIAMGAMGMQSIAVADEKNMDKIEKCYWSVYRMALVNGHWIT